MTTKLLVGLGLLILPGSTGFGSETTESLDPFLVILDTGLPEAEVTQFYSELATDYDYAPLREYASASDPPWRKYYPVSGSSGPGWSTGTAWYLDESGQQIAIRFWSVPGETQFAELVDFLLSRRGPDAIAEGGEFQKTVTVPVPQKTQGQPVRTWQDAYVAYSDGFVILGGSARAFSLSLDEVRSAEAEGRGKYWYARLTPRSVPSAFRSAFVTEVEKHVGVAIQRRDRESGLEYELRRTIAEGTLKLLHAFLFDVDHVSVSTSWPAEGRPYQARLEVRASENTPLDVFLTALAPRSESLSIESDDSAIGSIAVNMGIPHDIQPIVIALLATSQIDDEVLLASIRNTVDNGRVEIRALVGDDTNRIGIASGGVRVHEPVPQPETIARWLGGTSQDGNVYFSIDYPYRDPAMPVPSLAVDVRDQIARFRLSTRMTRLENIDVSLADSEPKRVNGRIAYLHLDLSKVANRPADSYSWQLLQDLEAIWERHHVMSIHGEIIRFTGMNHEFDTSRSLANRITAEGDWTVHAEIIASRGSLVANSTIGRDLHRMLIAKQLLTRHAAVNAMRLQLQQVPTP